jgi:hypothetical protein
MIEDMPEETIDWGKGYEDFEVKGSWSTTAIQLNAAGDQILYSRNMDKYQYRVLKRITNEKTHYGKSVASWIEVPERNGPEIDRKTDRIFICILLNEVEVR